MLNLDDIDIPAIQLEYCDAKIVKNYSNAVPFISFLHDLLIQIVELIIASRGEELLPLRQKAGEMHVEINYMLSQLTKKFEKYKSAGSEE